MFYASGKHVYEATKNEKTGLYHEVHVSVDIDGNVVVKTLDKGVDTKPKNRQCLTFVELQARKDFYITPVQQQAGSGDQK